MEIRPFRGWRYAAVDISKLIAPPYDILSAADKSALLAGSENNIVAVDLPHVPPKEVGPDSEYVAAATLLSQWMKSGVLTQDGKPALYAYEQTFTWAGKTYSRRALLVGVRATPFGQDVIPHEHTFAGPKADRLKLTQYTKVQLSPIFGFYNDDGAAEILWDAAAKVSPISGKLGDVTEKLWVITDQAVIDKVAASMKKAPVFIADGHHRYTTAMNYRDSLKATGAIDDNHEANFVMFALVPKDDAGLLILPTHRIVKNLPAEFTLEKLASAAPEFTWQSRKISAADLCDADAFLSQFGPTSMAFIHGSDAMIATLKDKAAMDKAAPQELPVWRELDVAILHKLIIEKALATFAGEPAIEYTPDGQAVVQACNRDKNLLGICLQSTPLSAVEKIALAGSTMPHKSTYFYPKLATGMVLKPVE